MDKASYFWQGEKVLLSTEHIHVTSFLYCAIHFKLYDTGAKIINL